MFLKSLQGDFFAFLQELSEVAVFQLAMQHHQHFRPLALLGHSISHDLVSLENALLSFFWGGDLHANLLKVKNFTLCVVLSVRTFPFRPQLKWNYSTEHWATVTQQSLITDRDLEKQGYKSSKFFNTGIYMRTTIAKLYLHWSKSHIKTCPAHESKNCYISHECSNVQ